ncbi:glycoside hydrolase family 3 N-terminal domain-containing protein [Thermopolyspora sp. NPDC052614]|uniref:glycoside hydrolase family 3 protein n=1 Tax=Thermopolyspora sp. NPDC052614 TaxID=3155682 RepID=UPI0034182F0D
MSRDPALLRLADGVILPGFAGRRAPDWVRRRLADGLVGVVLFSRNIGDADQVARLTADLRAERPDVIVGIDEESGEVTRLEAATGSTRPGNYALGVVDDVKLTEELARDLGQALAGVGVTITFAPAADVNSNPDNPVIGLRSFGDDPRLVARHTAAWIRGLQAAGVAACAKHFPGHGDTAVDSHHGVPVVTGSREALAQVELLPFRAAIEEGVAAIMTGHLVVTAYDDERPATLSPRILGDLLRRELGFDGPVITDGIEMAAVAERYGLAGAATHAIAAGADGICVGGENCGEEIVEELREAIADAVVEGLIPEDRLAEAAERMRGLAARTASAATAGSPSGPAGSGEASGGLSWESSSGAAWGSGISGDVPLGLYAARRALRVTQRRSAVLPLRAAPHVIEMSPLLSLAVDRHTPWGVGGPLTELMPGTTVTRLPESGDGPPPDAADLDAALAAAAGRPLVIVVRYANRHRWLTEAIDHLLAARPDGIVVEMGLPGRTDLGAAHIATHGSARVCGQAAAEVLAGVTSP